MIGFLDSYSCMKRKHIFSSTLLIIISIAFFDLNFCFVSAQTISVAVENSIYDFLERSSIRQMITLNEAVKPYSRLHITRKLLELDEDRGYLTNFEKEELDFYLQEYKYEINQLRPEQRDEYNQQNNSRWFLYSYEDSLFNLKLSPIVGYGISSIGIKSGHSRWIGASVFSSYSDLLGLNFSIRDKGEFGSYIDKDKNFSSISGAWYKNAPNGIEYSELRGEISLDWKWGDFSLAKEDIQWGHGKFGQLILSSKPPSYPHIRLSITPVSWLRLNYIHGWLNSLVKDSAHFYYTYPGQISQQLVESYIPKHIAANLITVSPLTWLDISVGNAVIYSGNVRPEFLIPFMFYKFLDHNTGRGSVNDANGMMYLDVSAKFPRNFKFYSTVFIDVTEIRNILSNDYKNTWFSFTFGNKSIDLIIDNLDITVEYTRLNPWVYEHKDEVTSYKHINYYLGHWLGQNADQFRVQLNYQLLRGLKFKIFVELIRKGGLDEIYFAYKGIDNKNLPFLYSPLRKDRRFGLDITYEYRHSLILQGPTTIQVLEMRILLELKNSYSEKRIRSHLLCFMVCK